MLFNTTEFSVAMLSSTNISLPGSQRTKFIQFLFDLFSVRQLFFKYNFYEIDNPRNDLWVAESEQYHSVVAIRGCKDAKVGMCNILVKP